MKSFKIFLALICFSNLCLAEELNLSTEVKPLRLSDFPERPAPLLELGDPFLKPGKINEGFGLPTGEVLQPSLIVWGDYRTALQANDQDTSKSGQELGEWTNRLDLYSNLYLSSTERILLGVRPLDKNGNFSRYTFEAPENLKEEEGEFNDELNFDITTLFFEGDFGEIFPLLDPKDKHGLDIYFAVGRQPISWQDGMLINDRLDSLGISKINLKSDLFVNWRSTLLYAWNEINRKNLAYDDNSNLYGFSNEIDFRATTAEFDLVYLDGKEDTGDGYYSGIGFTHRIYELNHTFRVLGSHSSGAETEHNKNGAIVFTELSRNITGSEDFVYCDAFYGIDNFRSASRGPDAGGPLGGTGVLFASLGLGRYSAALNNQPDDALGSALGYQMFFNEKRQHVLFEVGGRYANEDTGQRAVAIGASFQTAVGNRNVLRFDTYLNYGVDRGTVDTVETENYGVGARAEWQLRL